MAKRHPSVEKRARQNIQRNRRNTQLHSALRTTIKKVVTALEVGDVDMARTELPHAIRALGKAASKGVIHRNHAARKISRLTRHFNTVAASKS